MQKKNFDSDALKKAVATLKAAIQKCESLQNTDELKIFIRDSAIQRFEFSFELAWKTLKRFFEVYMLENVDNLIASNLFRMGFEAGLIRDPNQWNGFKRNRNLTSHTYHEETAKSVYISAKEFVSEAEYFIQQIEEKIK